VQIVAIVCRDGAKSEHCFKIVKIATETFHQIKQAPGDIVFSLTQDFVRAEKMLTVINTVNDQQLFRHVT
jgi:hypothetical protein